MTEALPSSYWISHNAIRITLNAMNKYDYIQCGATGGAVVMCYMKGIPGLEYDAGHNYRRWPLTVAPVFFNDHQRKYVYVAIPRNSEINPYAFLAFPSVRIDIYGKTEPEEGQEEGIQVGSEDYYYVWLQGIISASVSDGGEDQEREWEQYVDYGSLSTDEAFAEKEASWWRYNADDDTVTFLKTITDAIFNYVTVNTNLNVKGNAVFEKTVRLLQGMTVGNDFVSGLLGTGGTFRKEADGKTYIEADKLYIRMKAYFDTVEIRKFEHSSGNRTATCAGFKTVRVVPYGELTVAVDGKAIGTPVPLDEDGKYHYTVEVTDPETGETTIENRETDVLTTAFYRCYYRATDGDDKVTNDFQVGDLAYCKTNNETLNQQYYWRAVIGKDSGNNLTEDGEGWIDLSNRASEQFSITVTEEGSPVTHTFNIKGCDSNSNAPKDQDDIVQLGNVNNTDRQGAIIEYVSGADTPSYQIYQEIGSVDYTDHSTILNPYSLTNKNYITLAYNSQTGRAMMNVYGDTFIGARDNSTYVSYDSEQKKLRIKAQIDVQSTVGNQPNSPTLEQYISQFASGVKVFSAAMGNLDGDGYPNPPYSKGDIWIDAYYPSDDIIVDGQVAVKAGSVFNREIAVCKTDNNTKTVDPETGRETYAAFNVAHWELAERYQHNFDYLATALSALQGSTSISGGLILSSLIALRDTTQTHQIWSGISGIVDMTQTNGVLTKKGYGIAAWYGGDMIDYEMLSKAEQDDKWNGSQYHIRWAKSVDRFDGSGYRANGNLSWDSEGKLTIKQVYWGNEDLTNFFNSFSVGLVNDKLRITPKGDFTLLNVLGEIRIGGTLVWNETTHEATITGGSPVLTETAARNTFVTKAFFNRLFKAYNGNTAVNVNDEQSVIDNLEILVGAWTKKFLSALGKSANGGAQTLAEPLASINTSGLAAPADAQDGMTIVWNKATQKWKYGTAGGGSGTLSSIALKMPTGFQVSGSPITGTGGTFTVSFAGSISPHRVLASPSTDNGAPSWRQLEAADITGLSEVYLSLSGGRMANTGRVTNMNADLLDDMHVVTPGSASVSGVYGGRVPFIGSDYVMDIGRYLDFHAANGTGDFTTRLYLHQDENNAVDANGNNVMLPSGTGVLALTSDNVASATKLQTARKIWGQNFDGTADIGSSSSYAAMSYVSSIDAMMYFDKTNSRVGIGTSSPSYKLHVKGYAFTTRLYLASEVYLEYNSANAGVKLVGAGFYTDSYVSALGQSASGGDIGGATALSELSDVSLSLLANGQALVYDTSLTTPKWVNKTLFTAMSYNNNVLSLTISGVTKTATIQGGVGSISFNDLTSHPTTLSGYGITDAKIQNGTITLGNNTITPITSVAFSDLSSHPTTIAGYGITDAKFGAANTDYVPITLGATTKNVLTSHQSLSGYLSKSGGTMTNTNLVTNMNADLLDGMHVVTPGTPTVNGVYAQRIPFIGSNYVMEVGRYLDFHTANGTGDFTTRLYLHENSNNTVDANGNSVMLPSGTGVLALTSDNVASATKLQNARTIWGQSFDGTENITGDMNDVWTINGKLKIGNGVTGIRIGPDNNTCNVSINGITSTRTINLNYGTSHSATDGGGIFFHYGNNISPSTSNLMQTTSLIIGESSRPSDDPDTPVFAIYSPTSDKVKVMIGQDNTSANGCSLQIGMVRLVYDSTNNALKVEKVDGTSASFYATGSVSALGFSAGTSAVDAMTFGYLTVNNRLTFNGPSGAYTHTIYDNSEGGLNINAYNILNIGSNVMMSNKRLYLSSSSYIYVSGSTLYFSNGTTTRTIATL